MPLHLPDRLEAGTLPVPAIASLMAGVQFVQEVGAEHRHQHECHLAHSLRDWCQSRDWITVAGNTFSASQYKLEDAAPVVSFSLKNVSADRVADALDRDYAIAVRAGLHCAARAHETLGTGAQGLVRVSFGFFNTQDELSQLYVALEELHNRIWS
jgi:selenocysteine lyase/cysteine desulfurase